MERDILFEIAIHGPVSSEKERMEENLIRMMEKRGTKFVIENEWFNSIEYKCLIHRFFFYKTERWCRVFLPVNPFELKGKELDGIMYVWGDERTGLERNVEYINEIFTQAKPMIQERKNITGKDFPFKILLFETNEDLISPNVIRSIQEIFEIHGFPLDLGNYELYKERSKLKAESGKSDDKWSENINIRLDVSQIDDYIFIVEYNTPSKVESIYYNFFFDIFREKQMRDKFDKPGRFAKDATLGLTDY